MDLLLWGTNRESLNVIKIIHVPCSKTRYHIYSNSCTVMGYNNIQTCGNARTCFGLVQHARSMLIITFSGHIPENKDEILQ